MKEFLRSCHGAVRDCLQHAGDKAHLLYFAIVFVEAHGLYAWAAGGCFALGLLGKNEG